MRLRTWDSSPSRKPVKCSTAGTCRWSNERTRFALIGSDSMNLTVTVLGGTPCSCACRLSQRLVTTSQSLPPTWHIWPSSKGSAICDRCLILCGTISPSGEMDGAPRLRCDQSPTRSDHPWSNVSVGGSSCGTSSSSMRTSIVLHSGGSVKRLWPKGPAGSVKPSHHTFLNASMCSYNAAITCEGVL